MLAEHYRDRQARLLCKPLFICGVGVERLHRQWYEPGHHISFQYRDKGMEKNRRLAVAGTTCESCYSAGSELVSKRSY